MNFRVRSAMDAEKEMAEADFPMLRQMYVEKEPAATPNKQLSARWTVCTPGTVGDWTAVGYYFGRGLHRETGVPIGLIHSSWGGTAARTWTSVAAIEANPKLKPLIGETARAAASSSRVRYAHSGGI